MPRGDSNRVCRFLCAMAFIAAIAGCPDDEGSGTDGVGELCGAQADCPEGSHCGSDGRCLALTPCSSDADCAGAVCGDGNCTSALVTETLSAPTLKPVDVLFVIDDSPGACDYQMAFRTAMGVFGMSLGQLEADVQFAVVTPRVTTAQPGWIFGQTHGDGCVIPGVDLDMSCRPRTNGVLRARDYALDNPDGQRALEEDLGCLVSVGAQGTGPNMGLEAMRQALSDPSQAAAFLRPGARLSIVFVSDQNDCSDGTVGDLAGPLYTQWEESGNAFACEWNRNVEDSCEYVFPDYMGPFVAVDGVVKLSINGKFVNGIRESARKKGYLCLESEGAPVRFRNIRIMELPSGGASGDEIAAMVE